MNNDEIKGTAKQAAGSVKEAAGKVVGNRKLEAEGAGEKLAGKAQAAVGKAKDQVKDKLDR